MHSVISGLYAPNCACFIPTLQVSHPPDAWKIFCGVLNSRVRMAGTVVSVSQCTILTLLVR